MLCTSIWRANLLTHTHTRTHANTHTAKEACTHTRVFLFFFCFLLLLFVHRRGISVSVYQTSSCAVMLLLLFFLSLGVCAYAFAFVYVVISSLLFMVLSFVRFVLLHAFCRMRFYFCLSFVWYTIYIHMKLTFGINRFQFNWRFQHIKHLTIAYLTKENCSKINWKSSKSVLSHFEHHPFR